MLAVSVDAADSDGLEMKADEKKLPLTVNDPSVVYISLSDCKHGWLYEIMSRNLTMGVFRKDRNGFVGIREKLGDVYLFVENHWDTGAPFGTVKPLKLVEQCPIKKLDEFFQGEDRKIRENEQLFNWLKEKGGMPPAWVNRRKHLDDIRMLVKAMEHERKK